MKARALCYQPFLKPGEAMIYCNLGCTPLSQKCDSYGIYKNGSGYYNREDLNRMLSGAPSLIEEKARQIKIKFR